MPLRRPVPPLPPAPSSLKPSPSPFFSAELSYDNCTYAISVVSGGRWGVPCPPRVGFGVCPPAGAAVACPAASGCPGSPPPLPTHPPRQECAARSHRRHRHTPSVATEIPPGVPPCSTPLQHLQVLGMSPGGAVSAGAPHGTRAQLLLLPGSTRSPRPNREGRDHVKSRSARRRHAVAPRRLGDVPGASQSCPRDPRHRRGADAPPAVQHQSRQRALLFLAPLPPGRWRACGRAGLGAPNRGDWHWSRLWLQ